jgi:hypothetical protein
MDEAPLPIFDTHMAPNILIDGFTTISAVGGVARLPCFSIQYNPRREMVQHIVLHLAMPVMAVELVHDALGRFLEQVRMEQESFRDERTN